MELIGYTLMCPDNDSYMNVDQYKVNICDCLDFVKNRHLHIQPNFKLKKKQYDISYTYDSYMIVSAKFKSFCVEGNYEGVNFYTLNNYPGKFLMIITNVKEFDLKRRKTRFLSFNSTCNEYNEVVGATPVCLIEKTPLKKGFYRTDIEFGNNYAKAPIFLVGIETGKELKEQKCKGLYLEKILAEYDWEKEHK